MLALWTAVTLACGRAPGRTRRRTATMRVDARSVMIFRLSTTPGTTSCSRPAYRSSVFSRTSTRSTSLEPRRDARQVVDRPQVGEEVERLAQAHVDAREARPDGRRQRALERRPCCARSSRAARAAASCRGARAPRRPRRAVPTRSSAPEAVRIRTTAADTSGPMPSPGMSVMVCFMPPHIIRPEYSRDLAASWAPAAVAPGPERPVSPGGTDSPYAHTARRRTRDAMTSREYTRSQSLAAAQRRRNADLLAASPLLGARIDLAACCRSASTRRPARSTTADGAALAALEKTAATIAIRSLASLARAGDIDHLGGGLELIPGAADDAGRSSTTTRATSRSSTATRASATTRRSRRSGSCRRRGSIDAFRRSLDIAGPRVVGAGRHRAELRPARAPSCPWPSGQALGLQGAQGRRRGRHLPLRRRRLGVGPGAQRLHRGQPAPRAARAS